MCLLLWWSHFYSLKAHEELTFPCEILGSTTKSLSLSILKKKKNQKTHHESDHIMQFD